MFTLSVAILMLVLVNVRTAGRSVGQYDWNYCEDGMNFLGKGGFSCRA
jgi:hypothetical protein